MTNPHPRRIVLAARPSGEVKPTDFRLETFGMPSCSPGTLLVQSLHLSLDPYMRGRMDERASYSKPAAIDEVMPGEAVCQVLESRLEGYAAGDLVLARIGWTTHAVSDGVGVRKIAPGPVQVSAKLGVLGMPGFTAYAGMKAIGKPQPGETVVVAAATGPVGSLVGQLARRAGARAVGIAGGERKCRYLLDELGFDAAVDHRSPDFPKALKRACPDGVDVYFENVGGAVWKAVMPLLNLYARVPVCGLIAQYNDSTADESDHLPETFRQILTKSLTLRGFINYEFVPQYHSAFLDEISAGLADGTIIHREDVYDGLESAPAAFIGMLRGDNFGKVVVRL